MSVFVHLRAFHVISIGYGLYFAIIHFHGKRGQNWISHIMCTVICFGHFSSWSQPIDQCTYSTWAISFFIYLNRIYYIFVLISSVSAYFFFGANYRFCDIKGAFFFISDLNRKITSREKKMTEQCGIMSEWKQIWWRRITRIVREKKNGKTKEISSSAVTAKSSRVVKHIREGGKLAKEPIIFSMLKQPNAHSCLSFVSFFFAEKLRFLFFSPHSFFPIATEESIYFWLIFL